MLEQSASPFAVIVMAHLKALATMRQPESRLEWKLRLAKALYDRDYTEAQIQQLFDFIDWLLVLDDRREEQFDVTIRQYEEERIVPTISRFEKRILARGRQQGVQEGALQTLQEAVLDILDLRFAPVPTDISESVQQIDDRAMLGQLHRAAVQVASLDEFLSLL